MAAPNAPNPVNPNDQNQDQDEDQVPAGQVPAHVPAQPVPPPVQAQLAPAGVMPVPQFIYQNWIGKKPEFSGKQNPIFLAQGIGWKHTISQKERR